MSSGRRSLNHISRPVTFLPSSITSWSGSAVLMGRSAGFGKAAPAKLSAELTRIITGANFICLIQIDDNGACANHFTGPGEGKHALADEARLAPQDHRRSQRYHAMARA